MPRHDDSDPESNYRSARQRSHTPGPRRRDRDLSPPYPPSSAPDHPPNASGAIPPERHPRFSDPAPVYDGHTPFYPPETNPDFRGDRDIPRDTQTNHNTSLQPAPRSSRPRSSRLNSDSSLTTTNTPSTVSSYSYHPSSRSRDRDRVLARPRSRRSSSSSSTSSFDQKDGVPYQRGPIHKTKKALENTFTPSTSGLGVGVLGAIVGGLAASEIEHRAHKKHGHKGGSGDRHKHGDDKTKNLISTIVGAAVGGLSANALEKQMEKRRGEEGEKRGEVREKERRVKEGEWERDRYRNGDRRY